MDVRPAAQRDIRRVSGIVSVAFGDDPVWGPALARADGSTDHLAPYWRRFVEGAMRFGTVRVAEEGAVSVWLPPGEDELSPDQAAKLDARLETWLGEERAEALRDLYARFEAARQWRPPHYYLSLLVTDPARRGQGIGQRLLAADLAVWDAEGIPAYLESTNPVNDHRYERAGFRPDGRFQAVLDGAWISTMWRPVGGSAEVPVV